MDVKELKLQTPNYGCRKSSSFTKKVLFHAVTAFTCSLFCSYSHWFPTLCSRTNYLVYVCIPNALSVVLGPKCLFLVGNVIVLILVGESKLISSSNKLPSSPDQATEEEVHVEVSQTQTAPCRNDVGDQQMVQMLISEEDAAEELLMKEEIMILKEAKEEDEDVNTEMEEEEEEEESGLLPAEELNKRVEEFIAKVNKQRWLEARSLVCGRG